MGFSQQLNRLRSTGKHILRRNRQLMKAGQVEQRLGSQTMHGVKSTGAARPGTPIRDGLLHCQTKNGM